jgi:hypothetical protein
MWGAWVTTVVPRAHFAHLISASLARSNPRLNELG